MKVSAAKSVTTPEVEIHYLEYGVPAGKPVILLHGFPDSPVAWHEVIEHLDTQSLRILVPCLRGYGETKVLKPELVAGQEAALGLDLLAFADALSIDRFHLAGHDWGVRTSYAAAILAPERIISLLALATPYVMYGGKPQPPDAVRGHWYQWFFQLAQGETMMREHAETFCHELWRAWSPAWKFSEGDFAEAAKAWHNPQFADIVIHYYRTRWGSALSARAYAEAQAKLNAKPTPKISVPTIYIQGGADACGLPAGSEDEADYYTNGYERVVLKSSGHFPHREDPKAVAKLLTKQLTP